jgi:8-oxo-dGTP pyrophosphatase MutT (NUDIX family)
MKKTATLCFLIRGDEAKEILLGFKKVGFGAGKYAGFGGKVETGEAVTMAAARELEEEAGVRVSQSDLEPVGELTFIFPANPAWSQVVHVFLAQRWDGTPAESREMSPLWIETKEIPFEQMWQDNAHWLPPILAGKRVRASFTFKRDNETIEAYEVDTWTDARDGP